MIRRLIRRALLGGKFQDAGARLARQWVIGMRTIVTRVSQLETDIDRLRCARRIDDMRCVLPARHVDQHRFAEPPDPIR